MKNTNRQTLPLGRSTKAEKAGLSLLRPKLFTVVGDTYKYFNEIFQKNISKPISKAISPFIARLTQIKFNLSHLTNFGSVISIRVSKKSEYRNSLDIQRIHWFNKNCMPWNY